jgi:hypothetical protein
MQLGEFTYIFLVFCIPFLGYIVNSTNPKKGFSILFISVISGTVFLIPSTFSFFGLFFLLFYLSNFHVKAKNFLLLLSLITYFFEIYQLVINKIFLFSLPIIMVASVFSLMMIGHWFLVDPTISRVGMKNIAKFSSIISILLSLLVFLGFFESSSSIFNIISSQELSYVVIGLYLSASLLSFGSYKSLQEKSYTGVMASTGLSYLSLIVSMGATGTLILSL